MPKSNQITTIGDLNKIIADKLLFGWFILGIVGVPLSLLRIPAIGFQPIMIVHTALGLIAALLYFFRSKIPESIIKLFSVSITGVIAIGGMFNFGLSSSSEMWIPLFLIIVLIMYGVRVTLFTMIFFTLYFSYLGISFYNGTKVFIVDLNSSYNSWLLAIIAGFISFYVVTTTVNFFINSYKLLLNDTKQRNIELDELNKKLDELANFDTLTKINNRRAFYMLTAQAITLMKREKTSSSIIMMDIDKFKNLNDTYGHDVGDKVLTHLASLTKQVLRKSDVFARYGGEEFIIFLPNTTVDGARVLGEKIRKTFDTASIDGVPHFTASVGCAEVIEFNIEKSIKHADIAMYDAKNSGRNKVCVY